MPCNHRPMTLLSLARLIAFSYALVFGSCSIRVALGIGKGFRPRIQTYIAAFRRSAALGSSVCSDLRFAAGREHHNGCRSPDSKLLVESSIESLSKLIDDLEPTSRLKTYWGRAVIQHPTFNKFACAQ